MGMSRRGRAKSEATFLELVKDALRDLTREVIDVKEAVADLKAHGAVFGDPAPTFWYDSSSWYDWQAWCNLGFEQTGTFVDKGAPHFDFSVDAAISAPCQDAQRIARSDLLAFRTIVLEDAAFDEDDRGLTADCVMHTWHPAETDLFKQGSVLDVEVRTEAAIRIQQCYREKVAGMSRMAYSLFSFDGEPEGEEQEDCFDAEGAQDGLQEGDKEARISPSELACPESGRLDMWALAKIDSMDEGYDLKWIDDIKNWCEHMCSDICHGDAELQSRVMEKVSIYFPDPVMPGGIFVVRSEIRDILVANGQSAAVEFAKREILSNLECIRDRLADPSLTCPCEIRSTMSFFCTLAENFLLHNQDIKVLSDVLNSTIALSYDWWDSFEQLLDQKALKAEPANKPRPAVDGMAGDDPFEKTKNILVDSIGFAVSMLKDCELDWPEQLHQKTMNMVEKVLQEMKTADSIHDIRKLQQSLDKHMSSVASTFKSHSSNIHSCD